nr:MAG TPA_asm: hypothetical protein [Bacteriophage sp.]DAL91850.1 MAG TPA: hypothetical protein [Caudoviricetes sp.]
MQAPTLRTILIYCIVSNCKNRRQLQLLQI